MTPTPASPPLRPSWSWLFHLAVGLWAGLLGATWLADVTGFPSPYTHPNIVLRVVCGLGIGLVTLAVVPFPDRTSAA
jgi:hypothetical protein